MHFHVYTTECEKYDDCEVLSKFEKKLISHFHFHINRNS